MINLYSGTPGSGKSLHLAKEIASRMKMGRVVIGNFPINKDAIRGKVKGDYIFIDNFNLKPDVLLKFSMDMSKRLGRRLKEGEILLIIDEAQLLFNCREYDKGDRGAWLSFFTQHRHYGYDIVMAAQFDRMIDRQIRSLFEYETVHRKIKNAGLFGYVLSLFTFGRLFVCVERWYPMKQRVSSTFYIARAWQFKFYDSYGHFGTDADSCAARDLSEQLDAQRAADIARKAEETERLEAERLAAKVARRPLKLVRVCVFCAVVCIAMIIGYGGLSPVTSLQVFLSCFAVLVWCAVQVGGSTGGLVKPVRVKRSDQISVMGKLAMRKRAALATAATN